MAQYPLNDPNFTNWMTQITQAIAQLGNPPPPPARALNIVRVSDYNGYENEDPYEWIEMAAKAADANNWNDARLLQVAASCLKGPAHQWYIEVTRAANPFTNGFARGNPISKHSS
jgi:hypothetical protein